MRLCINKRWRLVHLFETHNLHLVKNKFGKLRDLGLQEGINLSKRCCQDLINKWRRYNTVQDINTNWRKQLLISENQLAIVRR